MSQEQRCSLFDYERRPPCRCSRAQKRSSVGSIRLRHPLLPPFTQWQQRFSRPGWSKAGCMWPSWALLLVPDAGESKRKRIRSKPKYPDWRTPRSPSPSHCRNRHQQGRFTNAATSLREAVSTSLLLPSCSSILQNCSRRNYSKGRYRFRTVDLHCCLPLLDSKPSCDHATKQHPRSILCLC